MNIPDVLALLFSCSLASTAFQYPASADNPSLSASFESRVLTLAAAPKLITSLNSVSTLMEEMSARNFTASWETSRNFATSCDSAAIHD
ncbi:hypothetical protein JIN84_07870 [Luteolibacter yonseiensis]|uniref:Uncharacterized protein n=1 Tax=Luteolibacter yonseiensis TaxID=1144680 RepID=A0A934V6X8_9BACT|nr:hypothetical protein [Luteolibacter yonseiensis]MBK1815527.1 hypothetical protein [Luteolibacter yonseiensis]